MWFHGWWTERRAVAAGPGSGPGLGAAEAVRPVQPGGRVVRRAHVRRATGDHAAELPRVFRHERLGLRHDPARSSRARDDPCGRVRARARTRSATAPYANRVRHVGLVPRGSRLYVFFTAIGDAPERVLLSTIDMSSDWTTWRATPPIEMLRPEAPYECAHLPIAPSARRRHRRSRCARSGIPFVFAEDGRLLLFYTTCGEQGIAAADLTLP